MGSPRRSPLRAAGVLAVALALSACGGGGPGDRAEPNVLLVVVDTLRADRLNPEQMPELWSLSEEGLRFESAHTPRAKTTPAVASLFTGLYPPAHGVRDLTVPLPDDRPTLAERLSAAGWSTGAIVGNFVMVARRSGLDRGFDLWVEDLPQRTGVPPSDVPQRTAASMTDGALAALGLAAEPSADGAGPTEPFIAADRPWFLYLHYMDPHGAYEPPAEHPALRGAPDPVPPVGAIARTELHRPRVAEYNVPDSTRLMDGGFDAAAVRSLYDAEVRFADAELGRLFDALRADGRLENTLVIVTADHGESLGEHLYWFEHGFYAYDATCRVPLVVRFPDAWPARPAAGARPSNQSLADLAPTLLEILSLPPLPGEATAARGRSNAANWLRGEPTTHAVFAGKTERADLPGAIQIKAATWEHWKLIRRFTFDGNDALRVLSDELYNLRDDPGETVNLIGRAEADATLGAVRAALVDRLAEYFEVDADLPSIARDLEQRRQALKLEAADDVRNLEALGYW